MIGIKLNFLLYNCVASLYCYPLWNHLCSGTGIRLERRVGDSPRQVHRNGKVDFPGKSEIGFSDSNVVLDGLNERRQ